MWRNLNLFHKNLSPFFILFIGQFSSTLGFGLSDLNENIALAQCRGSCLRTFTTSGSSSGSRDESCQKDTDCYMCWSSCRLFQGNSPAKSTLCADQTACFPGCRTACKFYDISSHRNLTPALVETPKTLPASMFPPRLTESGYLVWEPPSWQVGTRGLAPNEVIVYIVMVEVGGRWNQHIQTSTLKAIIPSAIRESRLRVLAVMSTGLVATAERSSAVSDEPDATGNIIINGHSQPDGRIGLTDGPSIEPEDDGPQDPLIAKIELSPRGTFHKDFSENLQPPSVTIDRSWEIKFDLLSAELLANVEVSWDARGSGSADYMVTWTESAGGISGHLVTKNDRVEISLWTGQKYSIQVDLLGLHGNSVLRSSPKTINFSPEGHLEAFDVTEAPPTPSSAPQTTSTPLSVGTRRTTTTLSIPVLKDIERWTEDSEKSFPKYKRKKGIPGMPYGTSFGNFGDSSPPSSPFQPRWVNEASYVRGPSFSQPSPPPPEIHDLNSGRETNVAASPLMAWAVCLGVGAVVILILIAMAVRTLQRSAVAKRQQIGRGTDDYASETTASSVNSSAVTTVSQLSRNHQRRSGDSWPYETFYGFIPTYGPSRVIDIERPPPPHTAPPAGPEMAYRPTCIHNHDIYNVSPSPTSPSVRIDNASFVQDYLLTLDAAPTVQNASHHPRYPYPTSQ